MTRTLSNVHRRALVALVSAGMLGLTPVPALRALAEDLARRRRGASDEPSWIAENRRSIETIERKLYNRLKM